MGYVANGIKTTIVNKCPLPTRQKLIATPCEPEQKVARGNEAELTLKAARNVPWKSTPDITTLLSTEICSAVCVLLVGSHVYH